MHAASDRMTMSERTRSRLGWLAVFGTSVAAIGAIVTGDGVSAYFAYGALVMVLVTAVITPPIQQRRNVKDER